MRFVGYSTTSDWHDYYSRVWRIVRLSGTKWRLTYTVSNGLENEIIVICDQAWIETI